MIFNIEEKDLKKFVVVGDRVLIKPKTDQQKTRGGLYLPPGVAQNQKIQSGYILKTGPGYPIPALGENEEAWQTGVEKVKYISLQAEEGDLAIYIQDSGWEIDFNQEKFIIVPHSAILLLIRDEGLFK